MSSEMVDSMLLKRKGFVVVDIHNIKVATAFSESKTTPTTSLYSIALFPLPPQLFL